MIGRIVISGIGPVSAIGIGWEDFAPAIRDGLCGIEEVTAFDVDGCLNTNACCNTVAEFAEGKTVGEAWDISPEDVIRYLETLPKAQYHCAELGVGAFYLALSDCRQMTQSPWKKLYRKT